VIAAVVLVRGTRGATTRAFAWMSVTAGLWNLDIFTLYYFRDPAEAELWSRVFRVGLCLSAPAAFQAMLLITEYRGRVWRYLAVAGHALGAMLGLIGLVPGMLVRELSPHRYGWYIVPTRLYTAVAIDILLYVGLTIAVIWRRFLDPLSPRQRVQTRLVLTGASIFALFVSTNVAAIYGWNVYPLGNVGSAIWVGIIAYAIVRHRFMDLDYLVRKVVSFTLAAAVVLIPSSCGLGVLGYLVGVDAPIVFACASAAVALVAALLIPTLQQAIETRVHRAFFAQRYDYRVRLRTLAAELVHVLDEGELVRRLGDTLTDVLDLESCEVFLSEERGKTLQRRYPDAEAVLAPETAGALEYLAEPALAGELEAARSPAAHAFRVHAWEVALPLRVQNRLTGLVAVGRNRALRIVSGEDLRILGDVASAASVALENARLSRELRRSETALERANRLSSIGTLAAGIAHEIRNPLTAVKTFLDLLPQRLEDRDFLVNFRDLSLNELRRVTDLINDLLSFGRSTSTERRAVDVAPALDQVVRLLDSTARKRQVALELRAEPHLPAIWADPDQVKQIVMNLVLNAIEASPPERAVVLHVHAPGRGRVAIEVRDQGPGIPPDQLESIFHPFFTTKESGTGLGLALVHQMIVEHGGEITVESRVGAGSVFRVLLPATDLTLRNTGT
jgi:signal transduction histidine kinase